MTRQTQQPPLDYAAPGAGGVRPFPVALGLLVVAAALLTLPSFLVVMTGAMDEPYFGTIRKSDAFVQVGVGTALIVLWLAWSVSLAVLVVLRRAHAACLALLLWPLLAVFYLGAGVDGYVDDLIRSQAMPTAPTPPAARSQPALAP